MWRRQVEIAENNAELAERRAAGSTQLQESTSELERALVGDPGWRRFAAVTEQEFTPEGMRQMRAICRLMALCNPLLKRGLNLRSAYVFGQGVEVTARADGQDEAEQDIQGTVGSFFDDDANRRALTGSAAQDRLEHTLGTDGEFFIACFTRPLSGWVQARIFLADEISEVITNPEDRSEPWYYRRVWSERTYQPDGSVADVQQERLYPALDHRPASRPRRIGAVQIAWDSPVLHVDVNRPEGWLRGIPDAYAAVNWARAYKEFLEQWATLMRSLARFAWRLTAKGSQRAQAKAKLAEVPSRHPVTGERAGNIGDTAITPMDAVLEAIPKSGATMDAESGRPLAMMVASALDMPVTMLLSDPGQTGARAVAETLDRPTELAMGQRRELWASVYRRLARHVISESVRAPKGILQGVIRRDPITGREVVNLLGDTDQTIDVVWPDLDEADPKTVVEAVVKASETGTVPPEIILRLVLTALKVRNIDALMRDMVNDGGEFQWPNGPPLALPMGAAALALSGQDPAGADPGPMTPEPKPEAVPDPGDDVDP